MFQVRWIYSDIRFKSMSKEGIFKTEEAAVNFIKEKVGDIHLIREDNKLRINCGANAYYEVVPLK